MTTTTITPLEPIGIRHIRIWWNNQVIAWIRFESCCYLSYDLILTTLRENGYGGLKEEDFHCYPPYKFNNNCDVYLRKYINAELSG